VVIVDDGDDAWLVMFGVEVGAVVAADAADGEDDFLGNVVDCCDGGFFPEDTEILLGFCAVFGGVGVVGETFPPDSVEGCW
jgi:hypothetical protein